MISIPELLALVLLAMHGIAIYSTLRLSDSDYSYYSSNQHLLHWSFSNSEMGLSEILVPLNPLVNHHFPIFSKMAIHGHSEGVPWYTPFLDRPSVFFFCPTVELPHRSLAPSRHGASQALGDGGTHFGSPVDGWKLQGIQDGTGASMARRNKKNVVHFLGNQGLARCFELEKKVQNCQSI